MKCYRIVIVFFLIASLGNSLSFTQSSSVFDANYFDTEDGKQPPLRIGKGFDITDAYKQTRFCFTQESSSPANLSRQENSQRTTITLHFTRNDAEYAAFRSNGVSGKVSFLNLFTFGGSRLEKYAFQSTDVTERLIFVAKVDFGKFEFGSDPILNDEAKALINQKEYEKFISVYGTHYISGVRKEASVYVVLTRRRDNSNLFNYYGNEFNGGLASNFKISPSFEVKDEKMANQYFANEEFDLEIIVNGPSINKNNLQTSIGQVLTGSDEEKVSAIKNLISKSLVGISDPELSQITQYYFSPFTLYEVDGIIWDSQKETRLSTLNQLVVELFKVKTKAENYSNFEYLENILEALTDIDQLQGGETWKNRYQSTFERVRPNLLKYAGDLTNGLKDLESLYRSCSSISCSLTPECCDGNSIEGQLRNSIKLANTEISKIENLEGEAYSIFEEALRQSQMPECEKEKIGLVKIQSLSYNPYRIYVNGNYIQDIQGRQTLEFKFPVGNWQIKAEQISGYLFYPTVNNRQAQINRPCEELFFKVGFED